MSHDIETQLAEKIKKSPYFALQCDESTDVANCSQLLVLFVSVMEVCSKRNCCSPKNWRLQQRVRWCENRKKVRLKNVFKK